jgi:hypothetical protein
MKFSVTFLETIQHEFIIEAATEEEAIIKSIVMPKRNKWR